MPSCQLIFIVSGPPLRCWCGSLVVCLLCFFVAIVCLFVCFVAGSLNCPDLHCMSESTHAQSFMWTVVSFRTMPTLKGHVESSLGYCRKQHPRHCLQTIQVARAHVSSYGEAMLHSSLSCTLTHKLTRALSIGSLMTETPGNPFSWQMTCD